MAKEEKKVEEKKLAGYRPGEKFVKTHAVPKKEEKKETK